MIPYLATVTSARLTLLAISLSLQSCSETTSAPRDDRTLVIAHRGASFIAPEHTTAAYDRAIADGADYIEQDVARTKDGVLVVIHDASLDRTARGPAEECTGAVRDRTYAQLLRCDFGSWFNEQYPDRANHDYRGLGILMLEEVVSRYGGRAGLYVELKTPELYPGIEAQLVALLRAADVPDTRLRVIVQSFNLQSLLTVRQIDPSIPLVFLIGGGTLPDLGALTHNVEGLGLPASAVSAEVVRLAHDRCLLIHPYAGDSRLRELVAMGVDGIFTDRPDLLRTIVDGGDPAVPAFGDC